MNTTWKRLSLAALCVAAICGVCLLIVDCGSGIHYVAPTPNAIPSLVQLSPSYAIGGSNTQTVVITGTNFTSSSAVTYNGALHGSSFVSDQQLSLSLNQADLAKPGNYTIEVINLPPGGGASASSTFSVWQPINETSTGLNFAVPTFGPVNQIDVDTSTPGPELITFDLLDNTGSFVSEFSLVVYANPSGLSLNQWFEQNVDVNGILISSNAVQQEVLSDGSTALVSVGAIPYAYFPDGGGPNVDDAYKLVSSGQVISIRKSQVSDLMGYGYPTEQAMSELELEILGTAHF